MGNVVFAICVFASMVLIAVLCVIVVAVAAFISMTLWALVKPLFSTWIDWFYWRTM